MTKTLIQQKDITFVNFCVPIIGVPEYMKQILTDINRKTDSWTVIVGDFNTPLKSIDRSSKQKINTETTVKNYTPHHYI